jgi:hypothetical protein
MLLVKIGAIVAAIPVAAAAVVAGTGVVVVDVRESGPGGHHFVIPVPLVLAETAAVFAPTPRLHRVEELRQVERYLPVADEVLAALAEAPDGVLVRVDDHQDHVLIEKVGRTLRIRVDEPGTKVSVNVPLDLAAQSLRQLRGGRINAAGLVGALRQARLTDLVEVQDGNDHVKISMW